MRKKLPYLLIYLFLLIFILQIAGLIVLFLLPQEAQAVKLAQFTPQVSIGEFERGGSYDPGGSTALIGKYVEAIYKYSIGFVGILATAVLMIGGISFIVAGGNAERVGNAKAWISASLTGLVLVLASYMILNTINPDLVNFKITTLPKPGKMQNCCSSRKGPFHGFFSEVDGVQTYTCNPVPDDKREEYGTVEPYDLEKKSCIYLNGRYILDNHIYCSYFEPSMHDTETGAGQDICRSMLESHCKIFNGQICVNGCDSRTKKCK